MLGFGQLSAQTTGTSSLRTLTPAEIALIAGGSRSDPSWWEELKDWFSDSWNDLFGEQDQPLDRFDSQWEDWVQGSFDASDNVLYTSEELYGNNSAHFADMDNGLRYSDTDGNGRYDMITSEVDGTTYEWNVASSQWE